MEQQRNGAVLRNKALVYAACTVLAAGMVGWVVPRALAWPLSDLMIALWLVSSSLVCIGILLSALLVFVSARRARKPWILRGMALLAVSWVLMFVVFNVGPGADVQPLLALPKSAIVLTQGIVAGALLVLVVSGWRDLCDLRVWTNATR